MYTISDCTENIMQNKYSTNNKRFVSSASSQQIIREKDRECTPPGTKNMEKILTKNNKSQRAKMENINSYLVSTIK